MNQNKISILQEIGLTKTEAEAYLKLLELGNATAAQISKETKLHRPNTYDALDKLATKGLVSYFHIEDIKHYELSHPEQLLNLLKIKEQKIKKLLPELEIMQLSSKPKSTVSIFEGVVGARKMMTEVVEKSKEFYVLGVPKDFAKTVGEGWVKEWHEKRVLKKVWFHHLVNKDYYPHRVEFLKSLDYTTIKFLDKQYDSPTTTFAYEKGVVLFFLNPLVSVRVLNEDAATSFRRYFKMLEKIASDE